jgi:hypothetical protein
VYVYELDREDPPKQFRCAYAKGQRQPITQVAFSTDDKRIIARDQLLRTFVFDAAHDANPPLVAKGGWHPQAVADDGRTAVFHLRPPYVIGQLDPAVDLPTSPTFNPRGELAKLTDETENWFLFRATRVAFNPDRSIVAMLNTEGTIHLLRTATGAPICEPIQHTVNGEFEGIHTVAFCSQGVHLLTEVKGLGRLVGYEWRKSTTRKPHRASRYQFSPSGSWCWVGRISAR